MDTSSTTASHAPARERLAAPLALAVAALCLTACRAEPPEAERARLQKAIYEKQIDGLEKLIAEAERGAVFQQQQLAVGIEESVVRELMNATLPLSVKVGEELTVQVQKAEAYFRFTQAGVLLESRVSSVRFPDAFLALQLLGTLDDVRLEDGRFAARVKLVHAQVQGVSLGTLAKDVLDGILKQHLATIEAAIPEFEVPVRLEQAIKIGGLGEGPVSVAGGTLPLSMSVARVLPGKQRLWVLLDVKVGEWQRPAAGPAGTKVATASKLDRPVTDAAPPSPAAPSPAGRATRPASEVAR